MMCPHWTREVEILGELFTLPFVGENEVFSIYGNRAINPATVQEWRIEDVPARWREDVAKLLKEG